jgi:hypothetical protein
MSYDPRLDNNYRQVGDRIISERQHRTEQAAELLTELFPVHPRLQLLVGVLAAIAAAVFEIQTSRGPWTEGYVLLGILAVLVAGVAGAVFALFVLYGGAAALAYWSTGSITITIITPIGLAYIGHKWEHITSAGRDAGSGRTGPVVGRPVRIFAFTVLGTLAALVLLLLAFDHRPEPALPAQPTVAEHAQNGP